jgi:hypothetical protein
MRSARLHAGVGQHPVCGVLHARTLQRWWNRLDAQSCRRSALPSPRRPRSADACAALLSPYCCSSRRRAASCGAGPHVKCFSDGCAGPISRRFPGSLWRGPVGITRPFTTGTYGPLLSRPQNLKVSGLFLGPLRVTVTCRIRAV